MHNQPVDISIVIPVYNSIDSLPVILERVTAVFRNQVQERFELIFVDDCSSKPETWESLMSLARSHPFVRALRLTRNFGRTGAVLAGISQARGKWMVVMDDDLQHRPEDIPKLLTQRSHDVVLAQFESKEHGLVARLGSHVVTRLEHMVLRFPRHLHNSPFILLRRGIARHLLHNKTPHPFLPALYLEVTKDVVGVKTQHDPRYSGESEFSLIKRVRHFLNLVINNSAFLLRGVAFIGILMAFMSFSYGCYVLLRGAAPVPGWASLMIVILILGGLVLMSLGIAGEYLIRIIRGIESRPSFIIRDQAEGSDETDLHQQDET